jgi:nicotinamidase-related amidase
LKNPVVLLLVDFINDFEFEGADRLFPRALAAAKATAELRRRAKLSGVPVIYCNDNFGKWRSDFKQLLNHCLNDGVRGKAIAELLRPDEEDYFVLKPKHSGFHSTSLDILLDYLEAETLVLTGVAGDFCVMLTAHDAYMRDYKLVVPPDCVASEPDEDNRFALAHLAKVCKARVAPSVEVDFQRS